ncbi:hypothetical protein [Actinacidiphila paucisporea]|uniref:Uncharacterized protein n=1 Tax=Actinacidiphila paucisporea TaxID=310782 RepID=A0A1M7NZP9_9ACTN|nr:hypothetical protein [Actinacidiphila paucisporea]SHN09149.1 hypothetical protein SAMN05216499_12058 [Actinacidiphila paucisporea]
MNARKKGSVPQTHLTPDLPPAVEVPDLPLKPAPKDRPAPRVGRGDESRTRRPGRDGTP